jgi:hypothetical protein
MTVARRSRRVTSRRLPDAVPSVAGSGPIEQERKAQVKKSVRFRGAGGRCLVAGVWVLVVSAPGPAQVATPETASAQPTLEALLDLSIRAYGGEDALAGAGESLQRGTVTSAMRGGAEGRLLRVYQRPIRLRVEIDYPGNETEVRILDGGRGWRNGAAASRPMYQSMLLQAARLGMPALLSEFRDGLEDRGSVQREGKERRVLALEFHRGLEIQAEIDPETGRVLRSEGSISAPGGNVVLRFATEYSDFRRVDGLLVPFHEVNWAQGRRTGETQLETVEFGVSLPPGAFHPPVENPDDREVRRTRT